MDNIEAKALALVNEICLEKGVIPYAKLPNIEASEALCRTIEQHEAFRQEVSDALHVWYDGTYPPVLDRFIIPAPKPDPLVEALTKAGWGMPEINAKELRAALGAVGFEIREKGDD